MVTPLQSASNTLDGASIAKAFTTANISAGSKIIVYASGGGTGISATCTVKDNLNNVYTEIGHEFGTNSRIYIFALDATGDGTHGSVVGTKPTITATWTASVGAGLLIQELPGLLAGNTTAMADGTPGVLGGTAASTGSPTYSDTVPGQYKVAAYGDFGNGVTVVKAGAWTADANNVNASASSNCFVQYISSSGGTDADGFTGADTSGWSIIEVAFKLAGSSVPPVQTYIGGQAYRRRKTVRRQNLLPPPDVIVAATSTPEPVVVSVTTPQQFFNDNPIQVFRSSLQDVVTSTTTPAPVVSAFPNVLQWYRSSPAFQSRSSFQDVPAAVQPNVTAATTPAAWLDTPSTTIVRNTLQDPPVLTTPPPVVGTSQPDSKYGSGQAQVHRSSLQDFATPVTSEPNVTAVPVAAAWLKTPTTTILRNTLQDPQTPQLTTPAPVVATSQPALVWIEGNPAQVFRSSLQDVVVVSGITPDPVVVTSQPSAGYLTVKPSQNFRNTTQDPPVLTTPDPVVVNAPTPQALLRPNLPQILRNPAAPVVTPTSTPDPVVVGLQGIPVGRGGQVIIRRGALVTPVTWRDPQHLGGTVSDANHLGGTVTGNRFGGTCIGNRFGGTVIGNRFGGTTTVVHTLGGSGTVQRTFGGSAMVVDPWGGSLDEWTMQEIDINLGEFNDETLAVAITNNGSAYDLTGKSLQALFKVNAGDLDTAGTTITLTSPSGGIVITNAVGGLANIALPRADLQNASITFWRCDVVSGGLQNTAIYGKVAVTLL